MFWPSNFFCAKSGRASIERHAARHRGTAAPAFLGPAASRSRSGGIRLRRSPGVSARDGGDRAAGGIGGNQHQDHGSDGDGQGDRFDRSGHSRPGSGARQRRDRRRDRRRKWRARSRGFSITLNSASQSNNTRAAQPSNRLAGTQSRNSRPRCIASSRSLLKKGTDHSVPNPQSRKRPKRIFGGQSGLSPLSTSSETRNQIQWPGS